jgi:putative transposase
MKSVRKGYVITEQYSTYFVTFTIVGWVDVFTRKELNEIIVDSLKFCQKQKGLIINAYVIMSNHIHLIVRAAPDSEGLSAIIRDFKKYTSKKILEFVFTDKKESRQEWMKIVFAYHAKYNKNNSKYQVWQQNNRPKMLIHPRFSQRIISYIHLNPVRSKIVDQPEDYVYSSARNYAEYKEVELEVEIMDFGVTDGYVMM